MQRFIDSFIDETTERAVRGAIQSASNDARSRGENPRSAVMRALNVLGSTPAIVNRARTVAGAIPGITYTPHLLATALGTWFRTSNIANSLLPGDTSPFAQGLRTIFRMLPAATVGAGDALSDVMRGWVDNVQSDPTLPEDQRRGQLDRIVRTRLLPDRVFVAAVNDAGEIQRYPDRTPMVNDRDWIRAYDLWRETHRNQQAGARGRGARGTIVPAEPFPYDMVPFDQAVQALEAMNVRGADLDQIRNLFTNHTWAERLTHETTLVMVALSRASLDHRRFDQRLSEDLFKDLPGKVDIDLINSLLGARFAPLVINPDTRPSLSKEDYRAAVALIDQWLGGELVAGNKILRTIGEGYDWAINRGWNPLGAAIWALVISSPIWFSAILVVATFLMGVMLFIDGLFTPPGGTFNLGGYMVPGEAKATVMMIVGYFLVFATTWPLPIFEKLLNAIPWLGNNRPEWLTSIGRKIGTTALIVGGACAFAGWLGIPVFYRLLLPIGLFTPVGTALALAEAGRREMIKAKLARSVHYIEWAFGVVPLGICFVCGMIAAHTGTFVTGLTLLGLAFAIIAKIVVASKWLSVALVFLLGVIGAVVIYRKTTRFVIRNGVAVRMSNAKIPFLGWCFAGLMAALIAFIFLAEPAEIAKFPKIFDPKVSVTDITTIDAQTGARMRDREVVRESGEITTLRRGTVVTGVARPAPKSKVNCSDPGLPADVRRIHCK